MNKTHSILNDYVLHYDGTVSINSKNLIDHILATGDVPDNVFVTEIDSEVKKYNRYAITPLSVKTELEFNEDVLDWNIPEEYKTLDVLEYTLSKIDNITQEQHDRIVKEITAYTDRNLIDVLRTIIFVIDEFRKNNIVWGTGRGSSCSSYVLYVIGLHTVDCLLYQIDFEDFIK